MSEPLSPLKPFRFGVSRVTFGPPSPSQSLRPVKPNASGRRWRQPAGTTLSVFEGIPESNDDGGDAEASDADGAGDDGKDGKADADGSRPEDAERFNGKRRKVKRKASRIARPRDSLPGFKKGRGRSGGGGGGGGFKRPKSGTSTVGKQYLNRRMSVATYYGKDASVGDELLAGTEGAVEAAGEEIKRLERDLVLSGAAVEIGVPRCMDHGLHCKKVKVKKRGPNKGRFFFACAHKQRYQQCGFFVWEDEVAGLGKDPDADDGGEGLKEGVAVAPATVKVSWRGDGDEDEDGDDDDAGLDEELQGALGNLFGHDSFRPGQLDVMNSLVRRRSTMAVLPTGGGKSLCYQLYAAITPGFVIVVTPLISLMLDQMASLPSDLPGACFRSGQTYAAVLATERKLVAGEIKVLFIAPERLFAGRFQRLIRRLPADFVSLVVVDEAHCISEMGHNFRTSFLRLESTFFGAKDDGDDDDDDDACDPGLFPNAPMLAMTATATQAVVRDVTASLRIEPENVVQVDLSRKNLRLTLSQVDGSLDAKAAELVRQLQLEPFCHFVLAKPEKKEMKKEEEEGTRGKAVVRSKFRSVAGEGPGWGKAETSALGKRKRGIAVGAATGGRQSKKSKSSRKKSSASDGGDEGENDEELENSPGVILVYVSKQRECETVCNYLRSSRMSTLGKVDMYHAGMTLAARSNVQRDFDQGKLSVLVATVAFGMGLDSRDVRGVIHFDIPFSVEAYSQEVGRAGRDGRNAACHLFVNIFDAMRLRSRAHSDGVELSSVRQFLRILLRCKQARKPAAPAEKKARVSRKIRDSNSDSDDSSDEDAPGKESDSNEEDSAESAVRPSTPTPDSPSPMPTLPPPPIASNGISDTVFLSHRFAKRELDLQPETCDTICTYLERSIPGFHLRQPRPGNMRLRFFAKPPAEIVAKPRRGVSEMTRTTLAEMMKFGRSRNGLTEVALYNAPDPSKPRPSADSMLQAVRELKSAKLVDFELAEDFLLATAPAEMIGDVSRVDAAATACWRKLGEIERVRRAKADALVHMLSSAEAMLSDEEQSRFLHDALAKYFAAETVQELAVPDVAIGDTKRDAVRRAVAQVAGSAGAGPRNAETARQIARVLHGVQSAAFPALDWCRSSHWGKFIDVDFRVVMAIASDVVRERNLANPLRATRRD